MWLSSTPALCKDYLSNPTLIFNIALAATSLTSMFGSCIPCPNSHWYVVNNDSDSDFGFPRSLEIFLVTSKGRNILVEVQARWTKTSGIWQPALPHWNNLPEDWSWPRALTEQLAKSSLNRRFSLFWTQMYNVCTNQRTTSYVSKGIFWDKASLKNFPFSKFFEITNAHTTS